MEYKIEMTYLGGILSKNAYKIGRGTKPEVKRWMKALEDKSRLLNLELEKKQTIEVGVFGYFWDGKRPDIHNLTEVIADALKKGLGVDDRYFKMVTDGWECGHKNQRLIIRIKV
jgi:Holliday junction resolvase RusA-like endonuclease